MKSNFAEALQKILVHEGGFSDHPLDPGGMTNLGVTRRVWEEWTGHPVTVRQMIELTPAKVAPMYRRKYWDKIKGDELPAGVDLVVFDAAAKWVTKRPTSKIFTDCAANIPVCRLTRLLACY